MDYQPSMSEATDENLYWRKFMAMSLLLMRAFELIAYHDFQGLDLAMYGGWKAGTIDRLAPSTVGRYIDVEMHEPDSTMLRMQANSYFDKLLMTPFSDEG